MRHGTLHGLDQIWNQIAATLELHIDLAERRLRTNTPTDKPVVGHQHPHKGQCDNNSDNSEHGPHSSEE